MKRKHMITLISAITGAAVLSVSAVATYATASGYSAAKNAMKNIIYEDNLTMDFTYGIKLDGNDIEGLSEKIVQKFDKNGSSQYSLSHDGGRRTFFQDGMDVTYYDTNQNKSIDPGDRVYVRDYYNDGDMPVWLFELKDDKRVNNYIRFAEALCDTFVGDLKNNIVLTDSDDKGDTYSLNLDAYQIPELYQAGIEMIMSQVSPEDYYIDDKSVADMSEEEFYEAVTEDYNTELLFAENVKLQGANIDVTLDKHSRISDVKAEASLYGEDPFGKSHTIAFWVNLSCYDYGTTVCDRLDLSMFENSEYFDISDNIDVDDMSALEQNIDNLNKAIEQCTDETQREYLIEDLKEAQDAYAGWQKHIDNGDVDQYKEVRNSLLFGDIDDNERQQLMAEKEEISHRFDDVRGRGFGGRYYYAESVEVLEGTETVSVSDEISGVVTDENDESVTIEFTSEPAETGEADEAVQPEEIPADEV